MIKKWFPNFKINAQLISLLANIVTIITIGGSVSVVAYIATLIPQQPKPKDLLVIGQQLQFQNFDVISKNYSFWSQDVLNVTQRISARNTPNISKDELGDLQGFSKYFNEQVNQINDPLLIDKMAGKPYRYFAIKFNVLNQSDKKITNVKLPFSPSKDRVIVMEIGIEGKDLSSEQKAKFKEFFKKEYVGNNTPLVNLPEIESKSLIEITFTLAEPDKDPTSGALFPLDDYIGKNTIKVENGTYTFTKINFSIPQIYLPQNTTFIPPVMSCVETSSDSVMPRDCFYRENNLSFSSFYSIFSPFSPFSTLIWLIGFLFLIVISTFILRSVITTKRVLQQSIRQDLYYKLLQLAIKRTLENKHSEAILLLQQAISEGLDKETLKNNLDLTPLHSESEYKKLFEIPNP